MDMTTIKYLEDLQKYLDAIAPGSMVIPALEKEKCQPNEIGKRPMFSHSKESKAKYVYTRKDFNLHKRKCLETGALIILSAHIIVVDVDDEDYVQRFMSDFPMFADTVSTQTTNGRHFYFMATDYSRAAGVKDGAKQMVHPETGEKIKVDIKTMSTTGNGGVISIPPSVGKSWIIPPINNKMLPMPDEFVDLYKRTHKDNKQKETGSPMVLSPNMAMKSNKYDLEEVKALLDILDHSRCDDYDEWIKVGMCLHHTDPCNEMFMIWDAWSEKSLKYAKGICNQKWKTFGENRKDGLTLGSIYAWAKADNPYVYRELMNARVYDKIMNCDVTNFKIAEIAARILRGRYICSSAKTNTWYRFDGTLWTPDEKSKEMKYELNTTVCDQFYMAHKKHMQLSAEEDKKQGKDNDEVMSTSTTKSMELLDKVNDIVHKLHGSRFKEDVIMELQSMLSDEKFEEKLDSNIHLLAFTNGVYDLEVGKFRAAIPEDHLSICVGYEYLHAFDPELTKKVTDYWTKMHPNKDQRDYLLKTLARQLYGDSGRELFHIHAGKGGSASNGKTTCWQLLESILGEYVRKTQVSILTAKSREEASRPQPEYAYWRGRRMLYVTEPEQSECLHSGIVKDLTGGEKITYRQLYSNKYVTFRPQFKIHLQCNDPPKLDGTDDGMKRRMRKIDYISRFVEVDDVDEDDHKYAIDHSLFKEIAKSIPLRMAFLRHLLDHFDLKFNFDMPEGIRKTCECYIKDNDGVAQFVEEFIEKSAEKDAYFSLKQAKEIFSRQEYFNGRVGTLKTDLEKILKTTCVDSKRVLGVLNRYVFMGYCIKNKYDAVGDM